MVIPRGLIVINEMSNSEIVNKVLKGKKQIMNDMSIANNIFIIFCCALTLLRKAWSFTVSLTDTLFWCKAELIRKIQNSAATHGNPKKVTSIVLLWNFVSEFSHLVSHLSFPSSSINNSFENAKGNPISK